MAGGSAGAAVQGEGRGGRLSGFAGDKTGQTHFIKTDSDLSRLFDLSNVDLDFDFKILAQPVRTAMGKLKLRV